MKELTDARSIVTQLGGIAAVSRLTGRGKAAVSNWQVINSFPPNTYKLLKGELRRRGFDAPDELWRMIEQEIAS